MAKNELTNGTLAAKLDRATKTKAGAFDRERCTRFAKANGIWKPGYEKLDNGRLAMNTRNGMRGKISRNERVSWPR